MSSLMIELYFSLFVIIFATGMMGFIFYWFYKNIKKDSEEHKDELEAALKEQHEKHLKHAH